MPEATHDSPGLAAAKKTGRRAVLVTFVLFVFVFVGVSAWEILASALGLGRPDVAPLTAAGGDAEREGDAKSSGTSANARAACAEGVKALVVAVDAAAAGALTADDETSATTHYRAALAVSWGDATEKATEAACDGSARGRDAFAAARRFRQAQEGFVRRHVVDIAPLRRDVSAYLPR